MNAKNPEFPDDRTAGERRKNLSGRQLKQLELAGGVEGGMQAGSAGGPSESGKPRHGRTDSSKQRQDR
jgi:hypothetical protein